MIGFARDHEGVQHGEHGYGACRGSHSAPPSGNALAQAIDRWIYVLMAASFIAYTLIGFIPD